MKNLALKLFAIVLVVSTLASCEKESNFNYLEQIEFENIETRAVSSGTIIDIYVPFGTDYKNITLNGAASEGATVEPAFGTQVDFTNTVNLKVTAEDGSVRNYTINVFVETAIDFEELSLDESGYWNGSDGSGQFVSENFTFLNSYNSDWASWSGFAYSNLTDTETEGYTNQYSSFAGSGAGGSEKFGLGCNYGPSEIEFTQATAVEFAWFTNNTYAALSMKNGDAFAKKFGGDDGMDEDWFLLTVEGFNENEEPTGTVEVYLADYRFTDKVNDYIVEDWIKTDLSSLGAVKKLTFTLSSSDTGDYGMNTPAYFCIDNIYGIVEK